MKSQILTVKQVSQILGIGINQAYKALQQSKIPSIKFGKRFVIPKKAFEKWLENCGGK